MRDSNSIRGQASPVQHAWPLVARRLGEHLPAFPGPALVPCPVVPAPPLLPADTSEEDRAYFVARAVFGALGSRYGSRAPRLPLGREMRRVRGYVDFCDAADALEARSIAPAAWMAFSADAWCEYSQAPGKPAVPSVKWMTSPRRLLEREEWFRSVESRYAGGQLRVPAALTRLVGAWRAMQHGVAAALGSRHPDDLPLEELRALVETRLPREVYCALLEEAQSAASNEAAMLHSLMEKGAFLW